MNIASKLVYERHPAIQRCQGGQVAAACAIACLSSSLAAAVLGFPLLHPMILYPDCSLQQWIQSTSFLPLHSQQIRIQRLLRQIHNVPCFLKVAQLLHCSVRFFENFFPIKELVGHTNAVLPHDLVVTNHIDSLSNKNSHTTPKRTFTWTICILWKNIPGLSKPGLFSPNPHFSTFLTSIRYQT